MRRFIRAGSLTGLLVLVAAAASWAAANLNFSKSNINRFQGSAVVTATASFGAERVGAGKVVYVTPKVSEFVLTQFCASPVPAGIRLGASGLGAIAQTGATVCYSFNPGISLPKDSTVTCTPAAGANPEYSCMISGLLEI